MTLEVILSPSHMKRRNRSKKESRRAFVSKVVINGIGNTSVGPAKPLF